MVVTSRVPAASISGISCMDVPFVAVAHPDHPLLQLQRPLTADDLAHHVQVVVRDSGSGQPRDEGWLGAERRFTVSSMEASLAMVDGRTRLRLAARAPGRAPLAAGSLRRLPLQTGGKRKLSLHLVLVHPDPAGPALRAAVECFERHRPPVGASS